MFRIGDKIVHPMHGAGVVDEIVKRRVNGVVRDYYSLKLPIGGMLVMIPTDHCDEIGVRSVLSGDEAERVLGQISGIQVEMETNWNHRYRENMLRLKSGDLLEVAKVVKGLMLRDGRRGLSTGERKMLHSAKQILISEIGMAQSISYQEAESRINEALQS
ncbi:MAG: CarD family transcriptional regulator [Evtepia sp.]|uniref:CarD family transcriptional regulator n=1 Tax=Evtepia sp. TaxID=2773933 RepID=UPI002A7612BB|nr:CarD family transcriptional regulator [Evtepia sp.]MDY3015121.1 CarD family transcriptional regulator [Evtepia sp.]